MSNLPAVSRGDIETFLDDYYRGNRSSRSLLAVHGRCGEGVSGERVTAAKVGVFEIVSVRSELDLREKMPAFDAEARIVFVVPWSGEIPLDLAGSGRRPGLSAVSMISSWT